MRKVFTDFHHSSLLRSLVILFENRLGMEVYRPIGMEWYEQGYWAINDQHDTAKQYLSLEQAYKPSDGTPPLNLPSGKSQEDGVYYCADPGMKTGHRACTLEYFKNNQFDFVIASIPQHIPLFKELIRKYQAKAKLIVQMGNNWDIKQYSDLNVLASIAPVDGVDAMYYHQEFDLNIFKPDKTMPTRKIHSFINCLPDIGGGSAWDDYNSLITALKGKGFEFKSFGGQCPDGNMNGALNLAHKMRESQFIFHVKPGGDGFGHIIHNAYAIGRPVIARSSQYRGQLAEQLLVPGTFIDLDKHSFPDVKNMIVRLTHSPEDLAAMGNRASNRFSEVVDYVREAKEVWKWLERL